MRSRSPAATPAVIVPLSTGVLSSVMAPFSSVPVTAPTLSTKLATPATCAGGVTSTVTACEPVAPMLPAASTTRTW